MNTSLTIKPTDSYLSASEKYAGFESLQEVRQTQNSISMEDALLSVLYKLCQELSSPTTSSAQKELIETEIYEIIQVLRCLDTEKFLSGQHKIQESLAKKPWKKIVKDSPSAPGKDPIAPLPFHTPPTSSNLSLLLA